MSALLFLAKVLVILAAGFLAFVVLRFLHALDSSLGRGRGIERE